MLGEAIVSYAALSSSPLPRSCLTPTLSPRTGYSISHCHIFSVLLLLLLSSSSEPITDSSPSFRSRRRLQCPRAERLGL